MNSGLRRGQMKGAADSGSPRSRGSGESSGERVQVRERDLNVRA